VKASAQINIETLRKSGLEDGLYCDLSTKIGLISGNTNARNLSGEFRTDYVNDLYHLFFIADGARADTDNNLYKNKGYLHLRGQRSFTNIIGIEVFSQEEFNEFILLKERTLFGSGMRLTPFSSSSEEKKDSDFALHIGAGLMWEIERYNKKRNGNSKREEDKRLLRSTNYLSGKWEIHERLIFSATGYYQVDTSRAADFRVIVDGGFGFNITDKLLFNINVEYRFDNEPPHKVKNFDLEITNGLTYHF
jgi:hypothetical protein